MSQHPCHPRLTVTLCFDVATRVLLGHRISFKPPNPHSALLALQQVNQHARSWDPRGIPDDIQTDSSFPSTSLLQALTDLDSGGARELDPES